MATEIRQRKPLPRNGEDKTSADRSSKKAQEKRNSGGTCKIIVWMIVLVIASVIAIIAIIPAPIDPFEIHELHPRPHFNGTLAPNNELTRAERMFENQISGPESIVIKDGTIYTGTAYGEILKINLKTGIMQLLARIGAPPCGRLRDEPTCGRPLGMRYDVTGDLIVADAYLGIHRVNVRTGEVKEMVSPNNLIGKHVPVFFNDFDLDGANIYFSDSSRKWSRRDVPIIFLEGAVSGRLVKYNRKTQKSEELISADLMFANGVQISHDKTFILVAETTRCRILRYDLAGWKKGSYTVFANDLPGFPDNIRLSSTGGYWVGFAGIRRADWFSPFDYAASRPWIRKWLSKIIDPWTILKMSPNYGLIVEYDNSGNIVRSLHDPTGETIPSVSEVHDEGGILYLGSYNQPYLGRLDIREANKELLEKRRTEQELKENQAKQNS